jgi:hypothetical protein
MPKQARAKTVHVVGRSADSTNMPMTLDDDTDTRTDYVYKGEHHGHHPHQTNPTAHSSMQLTSIMQLHASINSPVLSTLALR